jgi:hypothetical protein
MKNSKLSWDGVSSEEKLFIRELLFDNPIDLVSIREYPLSI